MERPKINKEMIAEAASITAKQTSNIDISERHLLETDIIKVYRYGMDGFQLAKYMENCGWDVDPIFVEDMDSMDSNVRQIHRRAQLEWVEMFNIKPPHPIGTKTTKGRITGVYKYGAAQYTVKPNRQDDKTCGKKRQIINFEDIVLPE